MRHFLCLALSVATLALSVSMASAKAGLVTSTGALHATLAHPSGALKAAVAVTAVAVAADDHGCAAAGAQVASWVCIHRHRRPTGFGWTKPGVS